MPCWSPFRLPNLTKSSAFSAAETICTHINSVRPFPYSPEEAQAGEAMEFIVAAVIAPESLLGRGGGQLAFSLGDRLIPNGVRVLFGQRRIGARFSEEGLFHGRTITSVARDIKAGRLSPDDIPIEAFVGPTGELITVNNRSLAALSLAGRHPTNVTIVEPTRALLRRLQEPPVLDIAPIPGPRVVVTGSPGQSVLGTVSVP